MRPPGYGEGQPRLDDDRLPVVLVVLDGLGDRPVPALGDRTPSEAAHTPVLDELAARGASGWHLPFGWGRAPSSELAHWAMFGYADVPFPGRAVLEALGAGIEVPPGVAVTHAALRTSAVGPDGRVWITGRAASTDGDDAAALLGDVAAVAADHGMRLEALGGRGEALLVLGDDADGRVTDSDPFFEDRHPWLRVLPHDETPGAAPTADALTALLLDVRATLAEHPRNAARRDRGLPALDVLTTKWSGARGEVPGFAAQVGIPGAAVTSTRLYRGLAALLGLRSRHVPPYLDPRTDLGAELDDRLAAARELLDEGAAFVHVHTKATDDAGHTKDPRAKLEVLEAADPGLAPLLELAEHAVVAVTGDHATPSTGGVLHTGDPTPLVVAGPTVRSDGVTAFGEGPACAGWYGSVTARELLPLLLGHANRAAFLGHRPGARATPALPDAPEAMVVPPGVRRGAGRRSG
ncbi:alkaline phosphatase family protein [Actinomycetospora straminea]|uniref:2,3-bisphosphoglycerate-independent phosphoglycerate mutase n=1 Tax=Actinomycetospora straminea TaxID=663607 RepID=A0ABP9F015_9PSEU|nr:alkaline phosphatase family protein [Actinomycetospora straminea]MDD7935782.1 alkaline phosphatase family protein [Actinomycetospora straminea]